MVSRLEPYCSRLVGEMNIGIERMVIPNTQQPTAESFDQSLQALETCVISQEARQSIISCDVLHGLSNFAHRKWPKLSKYMDHQSHDCLWIYHRAHDELRVTDGLTKPATVYVKTAS